MALYIPHSIFHLARLLYVRPETLGPYYVYSSFRYPVFLSWESTVLRCTLLILSPFIRRRFCNHCKFACLFWRSNCEHSSQRHLDEVLILFNVFLRSDDVHPISHITRLYITDKNTAVKRRTILYNKSREPVTIREVYWVLTCGAPILQIVRSPLSLLLWDWRNTICTGIFQTGAQSLSRMPEVVFVI